MRTNFDPCLSEILKHEGGFSNHSKDPGGITNLGVTKKTYEAWVGFPVTVDIMRSLTPAHVKTLYKVRYWDAVKADDLPAGLDLCVFDFAVNAGPVRAAKYLQMMVAAGVDGKIGPKSLARVASYIKVHGVKHAIERYQDMREAYYRKLKTFPTFGRGWLRRVEEVRHTAEGMAK